MFNAEVKRKLEAGKTVFGSFFKVDSPQIAELYGLAGFDFLIVDPRDGSLVVSPSYSPEQGEFSAGASISQQIVSELLTHTKEA